MAWLLIMLFCLGLAGAPALAQDANYWDNQYGTKAKLLGGLVVGSPSDLSASFYNPAWLALRTDASLLLTTQALEYSRLEYGNVRNVGKNPSFDQFRPSPGFLGGRFRSGRDGGWAVTWTYLEKTRFSYGASARHVAADPAPPPDGNAWFSGEVYRKLDNNDSWYGAAFSRRIGERTAYGITPYLAYRSQRQRVQAAAQSLGADGAYADLNIIDEFEYWHVRLLAKLGVAFDYRPISFGLTVTTPSLGVMGSGRYYHSESATGLDLDGDGAPDDFLAATDQEELDARWRSPLSVAAGASWRGGSTGVHLTVEWFDGITGYDVLETAAYQAQADGAARTPDLGMHLRSLVNVGVGLDHRFSPGFALYAGFRSDFSAQPEEPATNILMTHWDLWHATAGASFQFLGVELTTGLEYSFAEGNAVNGADFTRGEEPLVVAEQGEVPVRYNRFRLLLGFDLSLLTGGG